MQNLEPSAHPWPLAKQSELICGPPIYFTLAEGKKSMSKLIHTSRVRIEKDKGPLRRAYVEQFETPIRFGVHTNIKKFYGIEPEEELPATLDHIVASVGG